MMDLAEWERGGALKRQAEQIFGPEDDPKPTHVGPMCRCMSCCCRDGQGHKHPDWIAWEERQRGRGSGSSAQ
jgi:hypothetical protein